MDRCALRMAVERHIATLANLTHREITAEFERLGLPEKDGSRRERVSACVASLVDEELQPVGDRILLAADLPVATRFEIEEALWEGSPGVPVINRRTRHAIADALDDEHLFTDPDGFMVLLDRWWVLDNADPIAAAGALWANQPVASLRNDVKRHIIHNPGDWTTRELFEKLGAFDCTDRRFCLFLEALTSSEASPCETHQRALVEVINVALRLAGVVLQEVESVDGYPRFTISSDGRTFRQPKNIIFASLSKPDIRLSSAVDNDVDIVDGADAVLVYSRPVGPEGLTWSQLQDWWGGEHGQNEETAKVELYRRLQACLPPEPPQGNFFHAYHHVCSHLVPELLALLPEVWFHWDPKTVRERGADALLRFRIDFLLLMPMGRRVVIEIDGRHHYATTDGRAFPVRYAEMVGGARDLQLSGYDVYRFGAHELDTRERAARCVEVFLQRLFPRYGLSVGA